MHSWFVPFSTILLSVETFLFFLQARSLHYVSCFYDSWGTCFVNNKLSFFTIPWSTTMRVILFSLYLTFCIFYIKIAFLLHSTLFSPILPQICCIFLLFFVLLLSGDSAFFHKFSFNIFLFVVFCSLYKNHVSFHNFLFGSSYILFIVFFCLLFFVSHDSLSSQFLIPTPFLSSFAFLLFSLFVLYHILYVFNFFISNCMFYFILRCFLSNWHHFRFHNFWFRFILRAPCGFLSLCLFVFGRFFLIHNFLSCLVHILFAVSFTLYLFCTVKSFLFSHFLI